MGARAVLAPTSLRRGQSERLVRGPGANVLLAMTGRGETWAADFAPGQP